ncbi:hypothetical protein HSRCO_0669 [Halanaeroarchaeum sp. HSR-CO]|nr:hypothetical protein HSRCO_0669 [Halanaeroarchaeum sp. HSR-CO]
MWPWSTFRGVDATTGRNPVIDRSTYRHRSVNTRPVFDHGSATDWPISGPRSSTV